MSRTQFTLCGNLGPDDALNPYLVCAPPVRQEILGLINSTPLAPDEIAAQGGLPQEEVLEHLGALHEAGLVERVGDRYKPAFAIFTVQDQARLQPFVAEMAGAFAQVVRANMDAVRSAHGTCGFREHGFSFADLAYILVGAYTLDYGGLTLEEAAFLVAAQDMPGGSYVFTGFDGQEPNLRASWMWGHAGRFGPFTFFGHGELPATGGRQAFPERAWRWRKDKWPEEKVARAMEELGTILVALYEAPMAAPEIAARTRLEPARLAEHLALLRELAYVEEERGWRSLCPVVDKAAKAQIQEMVQELWAEILDGAVRPGWVHLERLYRATAPARNGINIRVAFNPIHHLIFEQALRLLMEGETIAWPSPRADGARYSVWVEWQGKHGK